MDARLRVLVTAFGTVPGPNSHSSALMGMAAALRGDLDLVTRVRVLHGCNHGARPPQAWQSRVLLLGSSFAQPRPHFDPS